MPSHDHGREREQEQLLQIRILLRLSLRLDNTSDSAMTDVTALLDFIAGR